MRLGTAATVTDAVLPAETALTVGRYACLSPSTYWALWSSWRGSGGEYASSHVL